MDSINERISHIIEYLEMNISSFSKALGLSNNVTIGNIVGGRMSKPSFEIIRKIAQSVDYLNIEWLVTGKGAMFEKNIVDDAYIVNEPTQEYISANSCKFCAAKNDIIETKNKLIVTQERLINELEDKLKNK